MNEYTLPQYLLSNKLIFFLAIAWSVVWKGLALWKSARKSDRWWFIILLVVNTFGLIELFYLYLWERVRTALFPVAKTSKKRSQKNS